MTRETRERLIRQYARGYDDVAEALQGFPGEALVTHPLPGKWSAREIVHHLGDSESISAGRLRMLLTQEHPVIHGYDQDAYAVLLRYNVRDHAPALEAFRCARLLGLQYMELMADDDWERAGWHTESGLYTATTWLQIYAAHAHEHARQIARLRDLVTGRA
jgi:hypothetical protein